MVSFIEIAAKKKLNIDAKDPAMRVLSLEGITGGVLVHLCPVTQYVKGVRKGQFKYNTKHKVPVLVTDFDIQEQKDKFETETGNCCICQGSGKEWNGWSKAEGNRFIACKRCTGAGKIEKRVIYDTDI
jgi:hypothetical protein